jgi:hypothetical protein
MLSADHWTTSRSIVAENKSLLIENTKDTQLVIVRQRCRLVDWLQTWLMGATAGWRVGWDHSTVRVDNQIQALLLWGLWKNFRMEEDTTGMAVNGPGYRPA